jgi:hypothetical protein
MEVVKGLESLLHPELETKTEENKTAGKNALDPYQGDPLFKEAQRYHAETDHVAKVAQNIALHERVLKRDKHTSLFGSYSGATYDPILHEFVVPKSALSELKAIETDIENKRGLFREMSVRKRHNLDEQELYCDPLVHKYRMKALMFDRGPKKPLQDHRDIATKSIYRKLNKGDPLFTAATQYPDEE